MAYPSTADQGRRVTPSDNSAAGGPALAADVDGRPTRISRSGSTWLIPVVLALVAAGGLAYYLWQQNQAREAIAPAPSTSAPSAPPTAETLPAINHPIEQASGNVPPSVEQKPLPALMVSDTPMQNALADLFGSATLGKIFYEDAIIHRFVSTVDNLPRKTLPLRYLPVKPVGSAFAASGGDQALAIGADNAARYAPYARIADAIDAKTLVGVYVHFYPLLQQDYVALGYPHGYFNDRLVQTIDDLLAAPDVTSPLALVQPKVLYLYSDPDLESRSAGQKIMMRMGADNATRIKAKLREIRALLTGPGAAQLKKK
jgi:hypothetical protein